MGAVLSPVTCHLSLTVAFAEAPKPSCGCMQHATAYRRDSAKTEKQVIDMSYKLPAQEGATPACILTIFHLAWD